MIGIIITLAWFVRTVYENKNLQPKKKVSRHNKSQPHYFFLLFCGKCLVWFGTVKGSQFAHTQKKKEKKNSAISEIRQTHRKTHLDVHTQSTRFVVG